ncbi:MAG: D-glycero-beta-D-manno-heptose 1-phosphate adenylyltransferase [Deltaproteobacteria bacterium]|nr:MAG: D-glycero-beta-D-manno-heptose 1-phosphate adenylyltransferase [Deltaproteobacteria bacterium]
MRIRKTDKILETEALAEALISFRRSGRKIVFTNGCFDILHAGHVRYLSAARDQGDLLVLGLNSDESVRKIKGPRRPIVGQAQRAEVLAGLICVDYISVFDDADPLALIKAVKPDVLVKGADWPIEKIIGADFVRACGGSVVRVDVVPSISTSRIIGTIVERYAQVRR